MLSLQVVRPVVGRQVVVELPEDWGAAWWKSKAGATRFWLSQPGK